MIYSLFKASYWLKNEDCIICYGDIIYDNSIIEKLKNSKKKFYYLQMLIGKKTGL